jgi:hypothetical protein
MSTPPSPDELFKKAAEALAATRAKEEAQEAAQLWTIEDVALYLTRTVEALRTMRKFGDLPGATRIGKRLYWDRDKLLKWIADKGTEDF